MGLFSRSAKQAPEPVETVSERDEEMPEAVEAAPVAEQVSETVEFVPPEGDGEIRIEKSEERPPVDEYSPPPVEEHEEMPISEEPFAADAAGDEPAAEEPVAEEPVADESPAEEPKAEAAPKVEQRAPANVEEVDRDPDEGRMTAADVMAPTRRRAAGGPASAEPEPEKKTSRAKVISFANQKGGVAKTTTTLNLAVAFAESGLDVLCIDLDPQGNLTMSQGIDPDKVEKSMYDVLVDHVSLREIIQHREIDIAVASIDLAGAEIAMSTQIGRERSLEKAIKEIRDDYDFICIDTPPSLGLLTINALTASDKVIVPVQCEYLSMRGLVQLQNTLEMIQDNLNPGVEIEGILPTMLDSRTVHAKEAVEILEENFGDLVFKSRIRKAVKFAEAPVRGSSVLKYDPNGNAASYYRDLAEEVLTHGSSE
jgi:chromosome partitioning protein